MNTPRRPEVSIVVPVYNEEDNVAPLCAAVREALAGWPRAYELIVVDDGSTDRTSSRLRQEQRTDPRLRVLRLRSNRGQTRAMATGFAGARGAIVVSMDGDLQNDPRDIPLLVARLESGYDVVCGWRRNRQDAWLSRILPSRIANWIIASMTRVPVHDNGCTLKAYRAELIRSLRLYSNMHRFLPALSSLAGARISEVVVRHHPRRRGQNKYGISRTFGVMMDILTIKMLTRFASRPGVWFAQLALPWALLATLSLGTWVLWHWTDHREASVVLTAVALLSFYIAGQLLGLSVLSEIYLVHSDRRYLQSLARILASDDTGRPAPGAGGGDAA